MLGVTLTPVTWAGVAVPLDAPAIVNETAVDAVPAILPLYPIILTLYVSPAVNPLIFIAKPAIFVCVTQPTPGIYISI